MVTFTNLTAQNDTVDRTTYTTASISPTGNRLVLLTVNAFRNTGSAQPVLSSVSGGGMTTWTLVRTQDVDTAGGDRATMWVYRAMQASPGSGAVSITFSGAALSACSWAIDQSSSDVDTGGTNGSAAIVSANIVGGTASAAETDAGPVNYAQAIGAGNCCWSATGWQAAAGHTERASWTELCDVGGGNCGLATQYFNNSAETAVSSPVIPSSRWGIVGLEIKAPSGTSGSLPTVTQPATSQAVTGSKSGAIPTPTQPSTAQALTGAKAASLSVTTQASTAQALDGAETGTLPTVTDTTTAEALTGTVIADLPTATDISQAEALTGSVAGLIPAAVEADTAQALVQASDTTLPAVVETDAGRPLIGTKVGVLPVVVDTSTPVTLSGAKIATLGVLAEVAEAQALAGLLTGTDIDITVIIGPTRIGTASVDATRVGTALVGATRSGTASATATRVGTAAAGPTRTGSTAVGGTRVGTAAVGDTRVDRGA